ncbi:PfkB domain protein [Halorhabdus utahensis DSM 12940]|uniref:PfkB domain protein n=1 Tax=Halorhabdus utahensis (strain DSM 12940 / JCM 11049 / AX-2) TaxID=519442 RepID=C7NNG8_HALUD|nr:sugar kinase [Halorhabdus utahensis]ACV10196.1 PfkB domain protein [Halorhabdus utahensis DSM 12940]
MPSLITVGETPLRLSPPGNRRFVGSETVQLTATGTESNVAIAAAALGADATWASKLPSTQLGKRVVSELREYGVETDVAWTESGRVGLEFRQPGVPPREPVIIHDRDGATAGSMTPADIPMDDVEAADGVFVAGSSAALSETAAETVAAVLRASGSDNGLSVFELDYRPRLWDAEDARETLTPMLEHVDVLIANENQLRTVFGRTGDPREAAHGVASKWDIDLLAMTRGEHGALVIDDSVVHEIESVEAETVDAAGQHDAFSGAFVAQLLAGDRPDAALSHAVAAATLTRTTPGPIPAFDRTDVESLVEQLE